MSKELRVSEQETKSTVSAIQKMIKIKNVPQRIFDQFQKVFGGTSLEVVPIRYNEKGGIEIFMIKRPENDMYWPSQLHVPGTMVFAWDWSANNDFSKPWSRLMKKEIIQNNEGVVMPVSTIHLDTLRGAETAHINNIVFKGPVSDEGGGWYPITSLPDDIIAHHKVIITEGVYDFVGSIMSGHYEDKQLSKRSIKNMVRQISKLN